MSLWDGQKCSFESNSLFFFIQNDNIKPALIPGVMTGVQGNSGQKGAHHSVEVVINNYADYYSICIFTSV